MLELALIGPVYVLIVFGLFEVAFDFFAQQALDYATAEAARQIQVGNAQGVAPDAATFQTAVMCPYLGVMLSCSNLLVSISTVSDYTHSTAFQLPTTNHQVDPKKLAYCNGGPGQLMLVQAAYLAPAWLTGLFTGTARYNNSTVLPITSTAAFITERFPPSGTAQNGC